MRQEHSDKRDDQTAYRSPVEAYVPVHVRPQKRIRQPDLIRIKSVP